MKKQVKILILAIILIISSAVTVNAADATATLNLSKSEVKKGDTFTVTLNASCEQGINGLTGTITYEDTKLELVDYKVANNWMNIGSSTGSEIKLEVLCNSTDSIKNVDICVVTFKVKDATEVGTTAKVTASNIVIDSDEATNSKKEIGTKEVEVSIIQEPVNNQPGDEGEGQGQQPAPENPNGNSANNNKDDYKEITEDDSKAKDKHPNTGLYSTMGIISIVLVITVIFFLKYNKYKEI